MTFSCSTLLVALSTALAFLMPWASPASWATPAQASRHVPEALQDGFRAILEHVDSDQDLTHLERLQRAIKRSKARLQWLNKRIAQPPAAASRRLGFQSSVQQGNSGEFTLNVCIGTPLQGSFPMLMDIGSELTWVKCAPYRDYFSQSATKLLFDPVNSTSFSKIPCSGKSCPILSYGGFCRNSSCRYLYDYADFSYTRGVLANETFAFFERESNKATGAVPFFNTTFGCGTESSGYFGSYAGIAGLGRGPLSLVSQLQATHFAYCLPSISDPKGIGSLTVGGRGSPASQNNETHAGSKTVTVRLLKNPAEPGLYFLPLTGISVGKQNLPINTSKFETTNGGGLVIDTGTALTYLEVTVFNLVREEFVAQAKKVINESYMFALDSCFNLPNGLDWRKLQLPNMVLRFQDARLDIPMENLMVELPDLGQLCLAMRDSMGSDISIFGNIQQQNMGVRYDLEKETVSFTPANCNAVNN